MSTENIVHTVALAHYFHSAFSAEQVYMLLKEPLSREAFQRQVTALINQGTLRRENGRLLLPGVNGEYRQRQRFSRDLFRRQRPYLHLLVRLPWVRFAGLTGANAFESCPPDDDVDLFIITAPDRLWLCYLGIVLFSRLLGRRDTLCVNYLVDENHLSISQQNYYTAVQLVQMIPLTRNNLAERLLQANPWIYRYLPNAGKGVPPQPFYLLTTRNPKQHPRAPRLVQSILCQLNRLVFRFYARRLSRKFPQAMGRGIVLSTGVAKLHRNDYQDIYDRLFHQMQQRGCP